MSEEEWDEYEEWRRIEGYEATCQQLAMLKRMERSIEEFGLVVDFSNREFMYANRNREISEQRD